MRRRHFVGSVGTVALGAVSPWAATRAQTAYPNKPVRIIVPLAPGGGSDAMARMMSQHLTERFNQAFVVENRPGASGILGADLVAKAPADGYTLLTVFSTHAMSAELFKKLPYDPVKDFAPVSLVVQSPVVLLVNPKLPIHSLKDFIDYAKANPNKLNYGSSGQIGRAHV